MKKIYPEVQPKAENALTEFGNTLIPIISALSSRGDKHVARLRTSLINVLCVLFSYTIKDNDDDYSLLFYLRSVISPLFSCVSVLLSQLYLT
jgi:hypothetical protein